MKQWGLQHPWWKQPLEPSLGHTGGTGAAGRAWRSQEPEGVCLHPHQQGQGGGVGGKGSRGHGGEWAGEVQSC